MTSNQTPNLLFWFHYLEPEEYEEEEEEDCIINC